MRLSIHSKVILPSGGRGWGVCPNRWLAKRSGRTSREKELRSEGGVGQYRRPGNDWAAFTLCLTGQPALGLGMSPWLDLFSCLAQGHGHIELLFSTVHGDFHRVAGAVRVHDLGQVLLVFDVCSVDGDNEVASQHDGDVPKVGVFVAAAQSTAFS